MDREDLEHLRRFTDQALKCGWPSRNLPVEGTYVVLDPLCVRVAVSSPSKHVDNDIFVDWLAPLSDTVMAKAVWGEKLAPDLTVAWRHHQHKLLDLLQTAGTKAYFEYLTLTL